MKSLFQTEYLEEIKNRINKLADNTQRKWGKMSVEQMLAHCSVGMETATGDKILKSALFLRLIGSMFKLQATNEKPFRKMNPTHPGYIIGSTEGFQNEKEILIGLINKFHAGGELKCTTSPHAFFGKLTPAQWSSLMYTHLDHHLRQVGV